MEVHLFLEIVQWTVEASPKTFAPRISKSSPFTHRKLPLEPWNVVRHAKKKRQTAEQTRRMKSCNAICVYSFLLEMQVLFREYHRKVERDFLTASYSKDLSFFIFVLIG